MLKSYLLVFFVSMVPLIELRGAIPIGLGMGLPILPTYLVCVVGNMIPVPFIYLFHKRECSKFYASHQIVRCYQKSALRSRFPCHSIQR